MSSGLENSFRQKCKIRLRTIDPCCWVFSQTLCIEEALVHRVCLAQGSIENNLPNLYFHKVGVMLYTHYPPKSYLCNYIFSPRLGSHLKVLEFASHIAENERVVLFLNKKESMTKKLKRRKYIFLFEPKSDFSSNRKIKEAIFFLKWKI